MAMVYEVHWLEALYDDFDHKRLLNVITEDEVGLMDHLYELASYDRYAVGDLSTEVQLPYKVEEMGATVEYCVDVYRNGKVFQKFVAYPIYNQ